VTVISHVWVVQLANWTVVAPGQHQAASAATGPAPECWLDQTDGRALKAAVVQVDALDGSAGEWQTDPVGGGQVGGPGGNSWCK
jgi:hypothetical protein